MTVPLWRAFLRLFSVQGVWNYERMLGIGMGYAALPLLERFRREDPARYREAVARQADFFNAQPYLAGLALGAATRAEHEGVAGHKIARLRTALCGPLGALGDQLFWTGVLPLLMSAALVTVVVGWPVVAIATFLVAFNGIRITVEWWGLYRGWDAGLGVGKVIGDSWLSRSVGWVGPAAGFAVGVAVPLAGHWLVRSVAPSVLVGVLVVAGVGILVARLEPRVTGLRFSLVAAGMVFLWLWVRP